MQTHLRKPNTLRCSHVSPLVIDEEPLLLFLGQTRVSRILSSLLGSGEPFLVEKARFAEWSFPIALFSTHLNRLDTLQLVSRLFMLVQTQQLSKYVFFIYLSKKVSFFWSTTTPQFLSANSQGQSMFFCNVTSRPQVIWKNWPPWSHIHVNVKKSLSECVCVTHTYDNIASSQTVATVQCAAIKTPSLSFSISLSFAYRNL